MNIRRKLIVFALLLACTSIYAILESYYPNFTAAYNTCFYYPWQTLRIFITSLVPFSVGDILYIVAGALLLARTALWIINGFKVKQNVKTLAASILTAVNTILVVYLLFVLGWGANYNKEPLHKFWQLNDNLDTMLLAPESSIVATNTADSAKNKRLLPLIDFNYYILARLNEYVPGYKKMSLATINKHAIEYYSTYTDSRVSATGLQIKASIFGNFLERMAVEGYYNPFTGEGQVNAELPAYVMPFLASHEMAHQAGLAAEEDANLMAYVMSTATQDSSFRYSAYLAIWQYANNRLYRFDSVIANKLESKLNTSTLAHLDTLDKINNQYHKQMAHYSGEIYDSYLKINDQKDGIRSYANVAKSARLLEKSRKRNSSRKIAIP